MNYLKHKNKVKIFLVVLGFSVLISGLFAGSARADSPPLGKSVVFGIVNFSSDPLPLYGCGSNDAPPGGKIGFVHTTIDIGCSGDNCVIHPPDPAAGQYNKDGGITGDPLYCSQYHNPVSDGVFSIIRFLSAGVGIVIVASTIVAGIQYTLSHDNPNEVNSAKTRIRSNLIALLIFIFAYAILNYIIPGGFFR